MIDLMAWGIVVCSHSVFIQTDVCLTFLIICQVQTCAVHFLTSYSNIFMIFFFLIDFPLPSSAILGIWCSSLSGIAVLFGTTKPFLCFIKVHCSPPGLLLQSSFISHPAAGRGKSFLAKRSRDSDWKMLCFFECMSLCNSKSGGQQDAKFALWQCHQLLQFLWCFVLEDLEINWKGENS